MGTIVIQVMKSMKSNSASWSKAPQAVEATAKKRLWRLHLAGLLAHRWAIRLVRLRTRTHLDISTDTPYCHYE